MMLCDWEVNPRPVIKQWQPVARSPVWVSGPMCVIIVE